MPKLLGMMIASLTGLLVSGVAAWGLVASITSAPDTSPVIDAPVAVYGSR